MIIYSNELARILNDNRSFYLSYLTIQAMIGFRDVCIVHHLFPLKYDRAIYTERTDQLSQLTVMHGC